MGGYDKPIMAGGSFFSCANWTVLALSPDGQFLLTGCGRDLERDGEGRLWDAARGELRYRLPHRSAVRVVAFSANGRAVLTAGEDKIAQVWHTDTGRKVGPALEHDWFVYVAALSPDGGTALTSTRSGEAWLWEAATGKRLDTPLVHHISVQAAAFSPDGKTVLTGSDLGGGEGEVRLWEAATGAPLDAPIAVQGPVHAMALGHDGRTVWMGCKDQTARVWQGTRGGAARGVFRHGTGVRTVAFFPDGTKMVTGGEPSAVAGGEERVVPVFAVRTVGLLGSPLGQGALLAVAAPSPQGAEVRLWDTDTGELLRRFCHQQSVEGVAVSPDGKTILTGSLDKTARLSEAATGKELARLAFEQWVGRVAYSPDGRTFLTSGEDNTARVYETVSRQELQVLQHEDPVHGISYSPDGRTVLTGCRDGSARLWDVATGKLFGPVFRHQGPVWAVAFAPKGKTLLTGSLDRTARLWETDTGSPIGQVLLHPGGVRAVAFSHDGRMALTGSELNARGWGEARLWEADTGKPLSLPFRHPGTVYAVALHPGGSTILTGGADGCARLWDVPGPLTGDAERIRLWVEVATGMELDPGGAARVLNVETWEERRRLLEDHGGPPP